MTSAFVDNNLKDLDLVFSPLVVRGYTVTKAQSDTGFTIDGVDLSERYAGVEDGERVSYDTDFTSGDTIYNCDLREIFAAKGTVRKFLNLDINNLPDDNNATDTLSAIQVTPTWIDHDGNSQLGSMFTMDVNTPTVSIDLNDIPEAEKPAGFVLKVNLTIDIYDNTGNSESKTFSNITL